jgi:arginyl-tRNA synthetase
VAADERWVYEGFEKPTNNSAFDFDKLYYESHTYLLGKDMIERGLREGRLLPPRRRLGVGRPDRGRARPQNSAAQRRHLALHHPGPRHRPPALRRFRLRPLVYVVADEQNYHFQVLFELLKRLEEPYADGLYHLSYGMVDLPTGKMKSREGTVVDADDLIAEVIAEARRKRRGARHHVRLAGRRTGELIIRKIGSGGAEVPHHQGAAPQADDLRPEGVGRPAGQTGPYVQNAYVRIRSVLRKAGQQSLDQAASGLHEPRPIEKEILLLLYDFPNQVAQAAQEYDPSHRGLLLQPWPNRTTDSGTTCRS